MALLIKPRNASVSVQRGLDVEVLDVEISQALKPLARVEELVYWDRWPIVLVVTRLQDRDGKPFIAVHAPLFPGRADDSSDNFRLARGRIVSVSDFPISGRLGLLFDGEVIVEVGHSDTQAFIAGASVRGSNGGRMMNGVLGWGRIGESIDKIRVAVRWTLAPDGLAFSVERVPFAGGAVLVSPVGGPDEGVVCIASRAEDLLALLD